MRPNYAGLAGAMLSFISLALPWWTLTESASFWIPPTNSFNFSFASLLEAIRYGFLAWPILWYVSLAFIVASGALGISGSLIHVSSRRRALLAAGGMNILGVVVFVIGFSSFAGFGRSPGGLGAIFYHGTTSNPPLGCVTLHTPNACEGFDVTVSSYLSVGYWLALVSGILLFSSQATRVGVSRKATAILDTLRGR